MKSITASLLSGLTVAACVTRPVGTQPPTTKVNFTSTQSQQAVDKVDLLFAIDNSASMGDKQALLADAVPNLLQGLLFPHCVDPDTGLAVDDTRADPVATRAEHFGCKTSSSGRQLEAEFKPVTDLHIGIVSSSLGTMGGGMNGKLGTFDSDLCATSVHPNDEGHLLGRTDAAAPTPALTPASFLAWFPDSEDNTTNPKRHPPPANAVKNAADLQSYFQSLVVGTGQDGCGLEAQLESMYRFLVQPDPYTTIGKDAQDRAQLGAGIDWDLLAQRAQFLRPDSLVAVVMLTDEDDSSADPLSVNGFGFNYASGIFHKSPTTRGSGGGRTAPLPTSICETDPGNAKCMSCGFGSTDPSCSRKPEAGTAAGFYGPDDDEMDVRFFHMKQRFGVDPQFPIRRYVNGLSGLSVPDRSTEHLVTVNDGVRSISEYVGTGKCTNPLFAAALPTKDGDETCNLPRGTRDPSLVFFAIVGGVPNELIYGVDASHHADYRPEDPDHNAMTDAKWTTVLGKDPLRYDTTGIDPHMVQSITPRPGIPGEPTSPRGDNGADAIVGRDWSTNKHDLQYACTFPLAKPRDCSGTALTNPNYNSCDCTADGSNMPLCQDATSNVQTMAKAYPTIRELELARALGPQGITASLCPLDPALTNKPDATDADRSNPRYGYNPAVASIIDRLKNALTQQCLPRSLRDLPDGGTKDDAKLAVPCLVLAQLAPDGNQSCTDNGLEETDANVLAVFHDQQVEEGGSSADGIALAKRKVCTVPQLPEQPGATCRGEKDKRWCYVENAGTTKPAGRCQQAIVFSAGTQDLAGARFSLQCIRQFSPGAAAGDTAIP